MKKRNVKTNGNVMGNENRVEKGEIKMLRKKIFTGALLMSMSMLAACGTVDTGVKEGIRENYIVSQAKENIRYEETGQENGSKVNQTHTHQFEEILVKGNSCAETGLKKYSCECGEFYTESIAKQKHVDGGWQLLAEPTEETEGLQAKLCQECGAMLEMKAIPVNGAEPQIHNSSENAESETQTSTPVQETSAVTHTHVYEEEVAQVEADCQKSGAIFTRCSCGDLHAETIPALGHDWEVRERADATCVTDGFAAKQCRSCKETERDELPAKGHTYGEWMVVKEPTYTEFGTKEQRCIDCNTLVATENVDVLPHAHDYAEVINEEPGCTTKGVKTLTCNLCGDIQTEEIPVAGHSEIWEITKEADCTTAGAKALKCSECGNISETECIPAKGHVESDWIVDRAAACTETGMQHKNCARCGAEMARGSIPAKGHSFGEFTITQEATCEGTGIQTRTCGDCNESVSVSIDAKGHSFGDWTIDEEASEEHKGERHKECADCGKVITEEIEQLPRHEHQFGESGREESTCTAKGSIAYSCGICGETYSEIIPMRVHTAGEWEMKKAPTEEEAGVRVKKCTVCSEEMELEIMEKLPHLHDYVVKKVEPACENDGYTEYTCSCGDSYTEHIQATGHSYVVTGTIQATCEAAGYVTKTCENCGNEQREEIEALTHNYVETERKEPLCGETGFVTKTCENCGDVQTEILETLTHSFVATNKVESTCTIDGYTEKTCETCGEVVIEKEDSSMGHTPGEWEVTEEPRLALDGEKVQRCTECGEILTTEKIDMLTTDGVDSVYYVDLGDGEKLMVVGHFDAEAAEGIYNLVNQHRTEMGLNELEVLDFQEMTDTRTVEICYLYDHNRPNGDSMNFGENILQGDGIYSAQAMYNAWMNSSGHRANIENQNYKYMGVAVFREVDFIGSTGRKYYRTSAVQTFGRKSMEYYNLISEGKIREALELE